MLEGLSEHIKNAVPARRHRINRQQRHLRVARIEVIHKYTCVRLLLLELNIEPVRYTLVALVLGIKRHCEVEICRPKFCIDLCVDRIVETFAYHNLMFLMVIVYLC